jgi:hypothetical protein
MNCCCEHNLRYNVCCQVLLLAAVMGIGLCVLVGPNRCCGALVRDHEVPACCQACKGLSGLADKTQMYCLVSALQAQGIAGMVCSVAHAIFSGTEVACSKKPFCIQCGCYGQQFG